MRPYFCPKKARLEPVSWQKWARLKNWAHCNTIKPHSVSLLLPCYAIPILTRAGIVARHACGPAGSHLEKIPLVHCSRSSAVTSESFNSREFFWKFCFSVSINFYFTFTSWSRFQSFWIQFYFSKGVKGEKISPFSREKKSDFVTNFHEKFN